MTKTFILDTNILMSDSNCIFSFGNNNIIIPLVVLEELDNNKTRMDDAGKNARDIIRKLKNLPKENENFKTGVSLGKDLGLLKILSVEDSKQNGISWTGLKELEGLGGDNLILNFCMTYVANNQNEDVTFITNDSVMFIKCETVGIKSEEYKKYIAASSTSQIYSGVQVIEDDVDVNEYYRNKESFVLSDEVCNKYNLYPNQFLILKNYNSSAVARFIDRGKPLKQIRSGPVGKLHSKNTEQEFLIDLLLDPKIQLVTALGKAGAGKTILALNCALEQIMGSQKLYKNLVVIKPVHSVGKEIGFLPGLLEEKLDPWMGSIKDNLRFLLSDNTNNNSSKKNKSLEDTLGFLFENGTIEMQALSYIRGRSIPNSLIIVDECFPYNQKLLTEDKTKVKIGKIVNDFLVGKKIPKLVTYNTQTKTFENKSVIGARSNGVKEVVSLRMANRIITVTDNHKFLTKEGWTEVKNLSIGDLIIATNHDEHQMIHDLSDEQEQILIGSFLGDGNLSNHGLNRFRLRIIHGIKQKEYCSWKSSMFKQAKTEILKENGFSKKPAIRFTTKMFGTKLQFANKKNHISKSIIEKINAKALAIWFMDDGNVFTNYNGAKIWSCSFSQESNQLLSLMLKEKFGIDNRVQEVNKSHPYRHIVLSAEGFRRLSGIIAEWVHPNLVYKLHPDDRKKINLDNWSGEKTWPGNKLLVVDQLMLDKPKSVEVFDIEVEDNHNFIACSNTDKSLGGFVAHNCQNTNLHEIKTILTRAGEGTKIVLTGDIEQVDVSYLNALNNGLTIVVEKFKDQKIAGHITLVKGERSELATIASEILAD